MGRLLYSSMKPLGQVEGGAETVIRCVYIYERGTTTFSDIRGLKN